MINAIERSNGYGNVWSTEAVQRVQADLFQKANNNGDSGIDQTEFSEFAKKLSEGGGPGASPQEIFTQYDADGNGSLNSAEVKTFLKDNAPAPPLPPGGMRGTEGPTGAQRDKLPLEEILESVDSDRNGEINQSEFDDLIQQTAGTSAKATAVQAVFEDYDTDDDNSLSADELGSFIQDNAPRPSSQTFQSAVSAYGVNMNSDQLSTLVNSLADQTETREANTKEASAMTSDFLKKLQEIINARTASSKDGSSRISVMT